MYINHVSSGQVEEISHRMPILLGKRISVPSVRQVIHFTEIAINSRTEYKYQYPNFPSLHVGHENARVARNHINISVDLCPRHASTSELDEVSRPCGDFSIVVYIHGRLAEILVRRLDYVKWSYDLALTIQSSKDDKSIFIDMNLGSSTDSSFKTLTFNQSIEYLLVDENVSKSQLIPKRILQTFSDRKAVNEYHWNAYFSFADLNPEYNISIFIDQECRSFIREHFSTRVLEAYDVLVPAAFKADLFRYCYLYISGGCYFDSKMVNRAPLRQVIQPDDDLLVCSDTNPSGIMAASLKDTKKLYNAVICAKPRETRILKTIELVMENVLSRGRGLATYDGDLALTGPVAFFEALRGSLDEKNLPWKHGYSFSREKHPNREYLDYYVVDKATNQVMFNKAFKDYYNSPRRGGGYRQLWKDGTVFYDGPIVIRHRNSTYQLYASTRAFRYVDIKVVYDGAPSLALRGKGPSSRTGPGEVQLELEDGQTSGVNCSGTSWFNDRRGSPSSRILPAASVASFSLKLIEDSSSREICLLVKLGSLDPPLVPLCLL